jgi:ribosomal protein L37AE/L43A
VTSINEKMGLRPAGKRSMMKLPHDRTLRSLVTSAKCPQCDRTGAQLSKLKADTLFCTHCYHTWALPPVDHA